MPCLLVCVAFFTTRLNYIRNNIQYELFENVNCVIRKQVRGTILFFYYLSIFLFIFLFIYYFLPCTWSRILNITSEAVEM